MYTQEEIYKRPENLPRLLLAMSAFPNLLQQSRNLQINVKLLRINIKSANSALRKASFHVLFFTANSPILIYTLAT